MVGINVAESEQVKEAAARGDATGPTTSAKKKREKPVRPFDSTLPSQSVTQ